MPNETEAAAAETTDDAKIAADTAPKGPPVPAIPPAITEAVLVFEGAVRAWWANQADASRVAPVCSAVTELMLARQEPFFESVPMSVRTHFTRFKQANFAAVQTAISSAVRTLIPWTSAELPPHLPQKVVASPNEGAD